MLKAENQMPVRIPHSAANALRHRRYAPVLDEDGREHLVPVTTKPLPRLLRYANLAALEQTGGPEFDFHIELPRREVWSAEVILDD